MLPLTLSQQRPAGSAVRGGANSPYHQRGALDGTHTNTHTHSLLEGCVFVRHKHQKYVKTCGDI